MIQDIFKKLNIAEQMELNKYINREVEKFKIKAFEELKNAADEKEQIINDKNTDVWELVETNLVKSMREFHISQERIDKILQAMKVITNKEYGEKGKSFRLKEIPLEVILTKDDFQDFCEEVMEVKCRGCMNSWKECQWYKLCNRNGVEKSGCELKNCKYAYGKEVV